MAKGKIKGAAIAAPPKCTCDDPYKCSCGNRPERPSRGHKWFPEEQIWGGKGHKQKGASGQTALVSEQAKVTATGKTQVAQWQRLPIQLLLEYCKGQKRPNPTFQKICSDGKVRYRCIVRDAKNSDKDLFFLPAQAVGNEEQAQEESALLALLQLTPNIPHERKLPEPYKTTWLNAIKSNKETTEKISSSKRDDAFSSDKLSSANKGINSKGDEVTKLLPQPDRINTDGAVASTNLSHSSSYVSNADKWRKMEEKRRIQNDRIRKHENIRRANQNHPVFMSVAIRQQIERLLRGDTTIPNLDVVSDNEDDISEDDDEKVIKTYVVHRLHNEGFARRQAKKAYDEWAQNNSKFQDVNNEETWDLVYDECLQWLLVHLDEDQLPEGFDPRGRTLDVVLPIGNSTSKSKATNAIDTSISEQSLLFATRHGISVQEASLIFDQAKKECKSPVEAFWNVINVAAEIYSDQNEQEIFSEVTESIGELFDEEMETLSAIFDSSCTITNDDKDCCLVRIALSDEYVLDVAITKGLYPRKHPNFVVVCGKWESKVGAKLHMELAKFISNIPLGEPMVFAISGHVQELLQSGELETLSLLQYFRVEENVIQPVIRRPLVDNKLEQNFDSLTTALTTVATSSRLRPKEKRKTFWTTTPSETPPAVAHPRVSMLMQRIRSSLPAAKSRREFLDALKESQRQGSRVVLVTGETGSGMSTHNLSQSYRRTLTFYYYSMHFYYPKENRLRYRHTF
jgi:hypothetical protein